MISQDEFLNALKAMSFISAFDLPELTSDQWAEFRDDPANFMVHSDDRIRNAIWREVKRALSKNAAQNAWAAALNK